MESQNNINNSINNVNIRVNMEPPTAPVAEKGDNKWLKKLIAGGIIALAVSVCGQYLVNKNGNKGQSRVRMRENVKQNMPN